ncbi:MAG: glycosyl hydrolase 53 family protein [Limisphaerales bacterium]
MQSRGWLRRVAAASAVLALGPLVFPALLVSVVADGFAVGADLSFLKQSEDRAVVFRDGGEARPGLRIFRERGYNWIRLRVFHTPTRLPNDLEYTVASAQEAKRLGFKFLLDYHYSDTWADPGKQIMPRAWEGKSHEELVSAVFEYTRDTIEVFRKAGVLPDMVQVGNEVTPGMLWPDGKLPGRWDEFVELLRAGIRGVREGSGSGMPPRIMIHIDQGGTARPRSGSLTISWSGAWTLMISGNPFIPGGTAPWLTLRRTSASWRTAMKRTLSWLKLPIVGGPLNTLNDAGLPGDSGAPGERHPQQPRDWRLLVGTCRHGSVAEPRVF